MNDVDDGRGTLGPRMMHREPPPELAERVRATLESRGLVRQEPRRSPRWPWRVGLLAAGFALGVVARGGLSGTAAGSGTTSTSGQYVLLLYGETPGDTGAVHRLREREYGRWASALTNGARWLGGQELHAVIQALGPAGPVAVPGTDRVAGYFVIEASSPERAAEVARSCPHLKYGGRVVVMAVAS